MTMGMPLKGKVSNRNGKGAPNSKPKNRPYKSSLHVLHTHFGHLIVKLNCTHKKINANGVNILLK